MYISMTLPQERTVRIPDNLDLAWHARLGINGLMGTIDPDCHYEPYFLTYYGAKPAYFLHWSTMVSGVMPKYLEALALLKCITGATNIQHETGFLQSFLDNMAEDGFVYDRALPERPWNVGVGYGVKSWNADYANVAGNGRLINGMWYYYQLTGDDVWKKAIKRTAEKLYEIAVQKESYAYYPDSKCGNDFSWVKSGWPHTNEPLGPQEGNEGSTTFYQALAVRGLLKWYQLSGDERMLDLSGKLIRFATKLKFYGGALELDPAYGAERAHFWGHTHGNMAAFRGILEYGIAAHDYRVLEFVRDGYDCMRQMICPQLGQNRWYESCCLGDLPAIAIQLTDAGMGDYWDDVDYAIRNGTVQGQITDEAGLTRIGDFFAERPLNSKFGAPWDWRFTQCIAVNPPPNFENNDHVIERSMGAFANALMAGRYQTPNQMACCNGNALQGFYYAWEAAIRHEAGISTVNLFYTRFSTWMDLVSYLPYEGKVVIQNKTSKTINVRIPGWIPLVQVRVKVRGAEVTPSFVGRYLHLAVLAGTENIEITFPQLQRTETLTIPSPNNREFRGSPKVQARFVGSTCTGLVEPPEDTTGSEPVWIKLFQNENYKKGALVMKETSYYVPDKLIRWY